MADAPLATVEDLEALLGRPLTADEATRAEALLRQASARVRAWTRQTFSLVENDVVVSRPVGTIIRLPQRPVQNVTQVVAESGTDTIPDLVLPAGSWTFDGIDKVDIWPPDTTWYLSLPEVWTELWPSVNTYRVTYSHGYAPIPDIVVDTVAAMVLRSLTSPSQTPGMVAERIGQYSYQMQQSTGASGATVSMTPDDKEALANFRRTSTTIQTRALG